MPIEGAEGLSRLTREISDSNRSVTDLNTSLGTLATRFQGIDAAVPEKLTTFNRRIGSSRRSVSALSRILTTLVSRFDAVEKGVPQRIGNFGRQVSAARTNVSALSRNLGTLTTRFGGVDRATPQSVKNFGREVISSQRSIHLLNRTLDTLKRRYEAVEKAAPKTLPTPGRSAPTGSAGGGGVSNAQVQNQGSYNESLAIGAAALIGITRASQGFIASQIESAVQLERQKVALVTVTGSVEAAEAQYQRLLRVARLPGINTSQALSASAQLQAIGLTGQEAAAAVGAFGNALATSGQTRKVPGRC